MAAISALWDAAFDSGPVMFNDEGAPIQSLCPAPATSAARAAPARLALRDGHRGRLARHRRNPFKPAPADGSGG